MINIICALISGVIAVYCFKLGNNFGGWANLAASSLNVAFALVRLTS